MSASEPGPANADARIFVVDDDSAAVDLVRALLARDGYRCVEGFTDPREALRQIKRGEPDLVILDLNMGPTDGFAVIEQLRGRDGIDRDIPLLVITGDSTRAGRRRALATGANDLIAKPFDGVELVLRTRLLLENRFLHRARRRHTVELEEAVQRRTRELVASHDEILSKLALVAEYRNDETFEHAMRVAHHARLLSRELDLGEERERMIAAAAPLHDIGKLGLSDALLLKPGAYTARERLQMQAHTLVGAQILSRSSSPVLATAAQVARSHHERWDGTGYPDALAEREIPLSARIVAVADVFDALVHQRPYKPAIPIDLAVSRIVEERGRHFDPEVVDAFRLLRHPALDAPKPGGGRMPSRRR